MRTRPAWSAETIALGLLLVAYAVVVTRSAWLCDDAYITFRSVDNFLEGYGLRWNVAERVQTYTHPLWMLLLTGSTALLRDFEIAPLLLSITLSVAAVAILALRVAPGRGSAIVAVSVLGLSNSFVDYSTSGLENPLSHLLLVLFALVYFGDAGTALRRGEGPPQSEAGERRLVLCFAIAGLAMLNRLDVALLYAPALATELLARRSARALGLALLALSPLLLWECFALFYYGFPFPNTAYAKLGTGIPTAALVSQGVLYLRASFGMDPLSAVAIAAGCGLATLQRDRGSALVLGVVLYLAYVVRIGGDFMAGRHLALPLLASVILLCRVLPRWPLSLPLAFVCALALGLASPHPRFLGDGWLRRGEPIPELHGVKDERSVYAPYTAVFSGFPPLEHPWREQGRSAGLRGQRVIPRAAVGLFGFHAGPQVHVVDANALGDPLLARLPARARGSSGWRIGHHARDLPSGYLQTLRSGENSLEDPGLAEFYDSLALVTRGELWSTRRLQEIARQLSGAYARQLEAYGSSAAPHPGS